MGSVGTPVVLRIVEASRTSIDRAELLAMVGLTPNADVASWRGETVDEDAYYALLERVGAADDDLPLRYGQRLHADDLGALGLAVKTAPTVGDGLRRLVRYVLVLSDTLEYEMRDEPGGSIFALTGRPARRRGAALANECALAATSSIVREISGAGAVPRLVSFRHAAPGDGRAHREFFGCPVEFGAAVDGIHLRESDLSRPTVLGDVGLSRYLLAQLDELKARTPDRSLPEMVRGAIADALPDGPPSRSQIARRLGMSERTLQRRLADEGQSFQVVLTDVRRSTAQALLGASDHHLVDVAFLTGFSDQTAFTRAFKRWTGATPLAYRRHAR